MAVNMNEQKDRKAVLRHELDEWLTEVIFPRIVVGTSLVALGWLIYLFVTAP